MLKKKSAETKEYAKFLGMQIGNPDFTVTEHRQRHQGLSGRDYRVNRTICSFKRLMPTAWYQTQSNLTVVYVLRRWEKERELSSEIVYTISASKSLQSSQVE